MLKLNCLFPLLWIITISSSQGENVTFQNQETSLVPDTLSCDYARGLHLGNRSKELQCCARTVRQYELYWAAAYLPLTRYLATLKGWRCPQFQEECQRKLFAINPFTRLVYKYFCEYESFVDECITSVNKTLISANLRGNGPKPILTNHTNSRERYIIISNNTSLNLDNDMTNFTRNLIDWYSIRNQIKVTRFTLDELLEPCMQVAQFEVDEKNLGNYQEVPSVLTPFCETSWCGFSGDTISEYIISRWTCLSSRCRANIIIIMVVCSLLAAAITVVNIIVILVISLNKDMQHSQSIYKISLAVADLLVGIVVLPICVSNLSRLTLTRYEHSNDYQVMGFNYFNNNFTTVNVRGRAGRHSSLIPKTYSNFAGFITFVSIFVSVYTLAGAGFDRLVAVYRPLSYRKDVATRVAVRASIASWCVAMLFAILPFFVSHLDYGLVVSFFITIVDDLALVIYIVSLVVPLVIVWFVNIATYIATRRHSKFRQNLSKRSEQKAHKIEIRLARTLALMVGAFSVSTVPIFLLILCSLFLPTIRPQFPRVVNFSVAKAYVDIELVAAILLLCNSFWNFFIYNIRNMDFRNAVKVMLKTAIKKTKIPSCCDSTLLCFQRIAYSGRRRLSSLPTLSYHTNAKRPSGTEMTKFSDNSGSSSYVPSAIKSSSLPETIDPATNTSPRSKTYAISSNNVEETYIKSETKNAKVKSPKKKNKEESMITDDSIFRSFAIDANADRLFMSVMENIEDEIRPEVKQQ